MKKLVSLISFFTVAVILAFAAYHKYSNALVSQVDNFALENVEALTQNEGGYDRDASYVRNTETCTITVGAGGTIKLLGGSILKADANGQITISGVVVCSRGGNSMCNPIECRDLYEAL